MSAEANWETSVCECSKSFFCVGFYFSCTSVVCQVCIYIYIPVRLCVCVFSKKWIECEGHENRQALRLPPSPCFRDSKHPLKGDAELCTSIQTLFNYQDQKLLHKTQSLSDINCQLHFILWAATHPFLNSEWFTNYILNNAELTFLHESITSLKNVIAIFSTYCFLLSCHNCS